MKCASLASAITPLCLESEVYVEVVDSLGTKVRCHVQALTLVGINGPAVLRVELPSTVAGHTLLPFRFEVKQRSFEQMRREGMMAIANLVREDLDPSEMDFMVSERELDTIRMHQQRWGEQEGERRFLGMRLKVNK